jgi:GNAT superfamily N-acetyltransferase
MSDIVVRGTRPEDLDELMRMAKNFHFETNQKRFVLFEDNISNWLYVFNGVLKYPDIHISLAAEDPKELGKLYGFFVGSMTPMFFAAVGTKIGVENLLWVDKEHRGNGYGKALINKYTDLCKKAGCSHAFVTASRGFTGWKKLGNLYRSLGFEIEKRTFMKKL